MRLRKVHEGHGLRGKLVLALIRVVLRHPAPGVVRTMLYRADFFGDRMNALTQRVMRGPSSRSVGERELFAAFVSRANRCPYEPAPTPRSRSSRSARSPARRWRTTGPRPSRSRCARRSGSWRG